MMGYIDRLKGMDSEKCPPSPLQKLQEAPFDSFCSSHGARFQENALDLERRILAMAERWNYSGDELALALEAARQDPDGWRRVVDLDDVVVAGGEMRGSS